MQWLENLFNRWSITLEGRWQPHGSHRPTPWNSNATAINLDTGKLKLSDQSSREFNPGVPKLGVSHRLPGPAGEDAQQTGLLIVKRWIHIRRDARSAFVRLHVHVPNLRRRELALVHLQPIMETATDLSRRSRGARLAFERR